MKNILKLMLIIQIMLSFLLPLFSNTVTAPSNFSVYLVRNSQDYILHNFTDFKIYYNNEGLTEFNLPLIVERNSYTEGLKLSDLKHKFRNQLGNFTQRLRSVTFSVLGVNTNWYAINIKMLCFASSNGFSVDLIPTIKNVDFENFAWFNSSWEKCKTFEINKVYISNSLVYFPVMIYINSDTNLYRKCKWNGWDIRFVDSTNTTTYNYEKANFTQDNVTKTVNALFFINVTNVKSSSNTIINMYYENNASTNGSNTPLVWSDYIYSGVFHCDEPAGNLINKASPSRSFYSSSTPTRYQTGKMLKCIYIDSDNDFFQCAWNFSIGSSGGFSYFVKGNGGDNGEGGLSIPYSNSGAGFQGIFQTNGSFRLKTLNTGGTEKEIYAPNICFREATWQQITCLYDKSLTTQYIYVNGTLKKSCIQGANIRTHYGNAFIGVFSDAYTSGANSIHYYFDEIRIYNTSVNSSWVFAEYSNINMSTNFIIWHGISLKPPCRYSTEPRIRDLYPENNTNTTCPCCIIFYVSVYDNDSAYMNISFNSNLTGVWESFAEIPNVTNGTYYITSCDFFIYDYVYYWNVSVYDGNMTNDSAIYTLVMDTYEDCNDSIDGSDIMSGEIFIENTQLFLFIALGLWLVFVIKYLDSRDKDNKLILGLSQFGLVLPLVISLALIVFQYQYGFFVILAVLSLSIVLLIDSLFKK